MFLSSNAPQNVGVPVGQDYNKPVPRRLIGGGLFYPLTPEQREASAALALYLKTRDAQLANDKDAAKC